MIFFCHNLPSFGPNETIKEDSSNASNLRESGKYN